MNTTPCPRCGSRDTAPLTGFAHHCRACRCDFGFRDPQQVIDAAAEVRKLCFNIGGFFGPSYEIHLSASRFTVRAREAEPRILTESDEKFVHTPTRFKRIIRRLYRHYHISDWNREYDNPDVFDGTQWELTLFLKNKRKLRFSGSNAYPPHFRKMLRLLAPYFHARGFYFGTSV